MLFHRLEDLHKNQTEVANKIHEYTKLKSDLTEISKHSSKRVMIPICEGEVSIAFFTEGYLKHTNEVLVHLGSNYFVYPLLNDFECLYLYFYFDPIYV